MANTYVQDFIDKIGRAMASVTDAHGVQWEWQPGSGCSVCGKPYKRWGWLSKHHRRLHFAP